MFTVVTSLLVMCAGADAAEYFAPSLFVNHGGGPYPILREKNNIEIADFLANVSAIVDLKRVKSIIVVTAHREERVVTVSSGQRHQLLYDYFNFPPESYTYKYDAEGDPALAQKLKESLEARGVRARLDPRRGWDHGVFVPMMLINPRADIPILQVSILKSQNASEHYDIGQVLYQFRKEGVAIIGSGMSYHNMAEFRKARTINDGKIVNEGFDDFLDAVCTGDPKKRKEILEWDKVPGGVESHPRGAADHLMPLVVCAGAGGGAAGRKVFQTIFLQKFKLSGYIWDKE